MFFNSKKRNIALDSLSIILKENTFNQVFIGSIKTFSFSWRRFVILGSINFLLFFSSSFISIINLDKIYKFIDRSNSILLALLAIIITGYALFQAMISKEALAILAGNKDDITNQNSLNNMQHSTFITIICYIAFIIFNYMLLLCLDLFNVKFFNDITIYLLLSLYGTATTYLILGMKSFIYNLYQIFTISSSAQIVELLDELDKRENT